MKGLPRVLQSVLMSSATVRGQHYRADGVRITHDPFAAGMAEKYGAVGQTDAEGFDPYRDSVGPGIYGGVVKRDAGGAVVVGRQYQNHNPRPGPVYAGGGYTPINRALGDDAAVAALLDKWPDLVNDVSTGGAQPLHMCGMSRDNQRSTALLVARGGDIEALDTYGMTPLHRMASNNLAVGARALLAAGADPQNRGGCGETPLDVALSSAAHDVVAALRAHGAKRAAVPIRAIVVAGAGAEVDGAYAAVDAARMPRGFEEVCRAQGWSADATWRELNGGATWYEAEGGAYVYHNRADGCWWIDAPSGAGVFKAKAPPHAPPQLAMSKGSIWLWVSFVQTSWMVTVPPAGAAMVYLECPQDLRPKSVAGCCMIGVAT